MITKEQIENLVKGDKLIFYRNGGVLSANTGNVFTFAHWWNYEKRLEVLGMEDAKWWTNTTGKKDSFQCVELLDMGNKGHNFSIYDVELFNPEIHKEFTMMYGGRIKENESAFISQYGG